VIVLFALAGGLVLARPSAPPEELWREVEVIRTAHGVLAVEFGDPPRAYSILAYGESPQPASPWHEDQAAMFARGELKKVAFTARDVDAGAVTRYRPVER
jgi:acyl-homoserine lactone acylase PvdQ